ENTLVHARSALPLVRFKQTYGLSELGIMATQSRGSDSVWLKLGGRGFEHKIVDGVLWVRSSSAMLGYLNAPSPFDADGWFNTQDLVEVDGEYIRILGRKSELINVGGEKVHPAEIENVLLAFDNVKDATVYGRPNPITGQIVAARTTPIRPEDPNGLRRRLRSFCQGRLERFKVPTVIEIMEGAPQSSRFKKVQQGTVGYQGVSEFDRAMADDHRKRPIGGGSRGLGAKLAALSRPTLCSRYTQQEQIGRSRSPVNSPWCLAASRRLPISWTL